MPEKLKLFGSTKKTIDKPKSLSPEKVEVVTTNIYKRLWCYTLLLLIHITLIC